MSEITGYIEMPFHGEKGESAYEIAQKYGYKGTEAEWVESLGFIPDGSIKQKKLDKELDSFVNETQAATNMTFDSIEGYEKVEFNIYLQQNDEYIMPYTLKGQTGFSVKVPKISDRITVFDESDETLYSSASDKYSLTKADVSHLVGKKIEIRGKTQVMPFYPLAFCVDEEGNILERYGTEAYCMYGYTLPENYETTLSERAAVEAVVPSGAKYLYIQGGRLS